ncbi:MAG: GTPase Era, partial [Planctomycetes bacterium]|nr:GTPase Era [Planctomycetota bacterium]
KSTLLNALVGEKVAIVTPKAQTTRNRILGVRDVAPSGESPAGQIVFLDTPGILAPKHRLDEYLVQTALTTLDDADVVLLMVDGSETPQEGDRRCVDLVAKSAKPTLLVINKLDAIDHTLVESRISQYRELGAFAGGVAVSALESLNLQPLLAKIVALLPEGPAYYPEGTLTDLPDKFMAAELVREQILKHAREEVPHCVAVTVDELTPRNERLTYVSATIHVEKDTQKGILIGEAGRMLKAIGANARPEIEQLLDKKVYLDLHVKVNKNWRKDEAALRRLGYWVMK